MNWGAFSIGFAIGYGIMQAIGWVLMMCWYALVYTIKLTWSISKQFFSLFKSKKQNKE